MPKVSVIVPIYGVEKYIERCVRSLFDQTLENVEFIFIDDCTVDRSIEILGRMIEEYSSHIKEMCWTVKTKKMPVNSGLPAARRYGLQTATGDYILHCDSDDWIEKNMLNDMWGLAVKDDLDVVVCDYNQVGAHSSNRYIGAKSSDIYSFFREMLSCRSSWAVWNKLFKRSLYDKNIVFPSAGMNMGEDMVIVIQLLYYSNSFGYVPKPYYNYCENPNSITQSKTVEHIIKKYVQCANNVSVLERFFRREVTSRVSEKDIRYLYHIITNSILRQSVLTGRERYAFIFQLAIKTLNSSSVSTTGKMCMLHFIIKRTAQSIISF